MKAHENAIFNRVRRLVGDATLDTIAAKRVIIFGIGGVGSWCAESLVRSGIHHLTIVDRDRIDITNVNRQCPATTSTRGASKVDVMKSRLLDINPQAEVEALEEVYSSDTRDRFHLADYDYIIDAIDSLKDKALLILMATSLPPSRGNKRGAFFSSMGAALKLDPTKIQVTEFWKVKGDPLARALRNRFKRDRQFPQRKFQCVFSDELLENKPMVSTSRQPAGPDDKGNGSIAHITAVFGFMLAGLVIQDVVKNAV